MDTLGGHSGTQVPNYIIDGSTGEMFDVVPSSKESAKKQKRLRPRYNYGGRFITMGIVNINSLIDMRLSADCYRLALAVAGRVVPVSNLCHCSNEAFAKQLGISKNQVARLMQRLCRAGLVYRMNSMVVMANPTWCFSGTAENHALAVMEWGRLHPLGVVRREDPASAVYATA